MQELNLRKPTVAGQFYSADKKRLMADVKELINKDVRPRDVIACIMPHAGFMYSGKVAGLTASSVKIKEKVIILGPNHTGCGTTLGIMKEGIWEMPFGPVKIDSALADKILKNSKFIEEDAVSHLYEHSLEVQLPFLQYLRKDFKIVPITVSSLDIKTYKEIGREIAQTIKELNLKESVLIIASSDMTHYESQGSAEKKDHAAIQAILELDEDMLIKKVEELNISMCGYAPVAITISCAKILGAKHAELIDYKTSGDITKDYSSVVGYAGMILY